MATKFDPDMCPGCGRPLGQEQKDRRHAYGMCAEVIFELVRAGCDPSRVRASMGYATLKSVPELKLPEVLKRLRALNQEVNNG